MSKEEVQEARAELREMTPRPMNFILNKQPVAEAIQKRTQRRSMEVPNVLATSSGMVHFEHLGSKPLQKLIVLLQLYNTQTTNIAQGFAVHEFLML